MSNKEIHLSHKEIAKLRDSEEKSFAAIAKELGANLQSVQACYEAGEDRVYRPRGKRKAKVAKANGNGHKKAPLLAKKAANGNRDRARAIVDRFVAELRAADVRKLDLDLATGVVNLEQANRRTWTAKVN